jgi:hypothetical protein
MDKTEVLKNCTVEGNVVKLPNCQLERKLYQEVAKALELIGGKWKGGKIAGFIFNEEPTELLEQIANGESRNLKKEFQFFATPDDLADELVKLAEINNLHTILEPSAGQGSIINAIQRYYGKGRMVHCYELMPVNQAILKKISRIDFLGDDFLNCNYFDKFDRIIANPPFSKNQDIQHIYKMYDCLKSGGRIVTIASKHWQLSNNKTETEFRNWLNSVNAEINEIPAGKFKDSGTMISSVMIIINKK